MRGLEKFEPASLDKRNVPFGQLDFQIKGVKTGAEQDRHFIQRHAFLPQLQDFLRDEPGLRVFTNRLDQSRSFTLPFLGKQRFTVFFRCAFKDVVGQRQDGLRTSVILFQLEHSGPRKQRGKFHNVPKRSAAKRVDRLRIISDDHHVLMRGGKFPYHVRLKPVGVLILVDQHVAIDCRDRLPGRFIHGQQVPEAGQQVIIIDQLPLALG